MAFERALPTLKEISAIQFAALLTTD